MANPRPQAPLYEQTDQGEQSLVPGVRPITQADRLRIAMNSPMQPKRPQRPCDIGLFDEAARSQIDWICEAQSVSQSPS